MSDLSKYTFNADYNDNPIAADILSEANIKKAMAESIQDQKAYEIDKLFEYSIQSVTTTYDEKAINKWSSKTKIVLTNELKQQLLALKERWEREAELDALIWAEHNLNDVNYSISDRIAQLGGKE